MLSFSTISDRFCLFIELVSLCIKKSMLLIHFWLHNIIPILLKRTFIHTINYLFSLIKNLIIKLRGKSIRCCITLQLLQKLIIPDGTGNIRFIEESSFTLGCLFQLSDITAFIIKQ